ncbi:hypothetical protein E2C01_023655 [Portunus trituberculatus]|uniref:DUF7047 domain-containing protein n=1 Tax=Portunus trituberculatus TaxID=210409 RepID=A0A5B7E8S9_PORTR|nr:hypothetical protein [Portunus trituberculatus]
MWVNGVLTTALVDTGCSRCIAHVSCCSSWKHEVVSILTVSGKEYFCKGMGIVNLHLNNGKAVSVDVLVVETTPLGFPFILGMNGIVALGGATVDEERRVRWLRVAVAFIKRKINNLTSSWDEVVSDDHIRTVLEETESEVRKNDPVRGRWDVTGSKARVWVDARSLALGVVIESDGCIIGDASWLRKDDSTHINMAELDAVVKELNLVLAWKIKEVELMTDSVTVHRWISDSLSGKSRLRTKAASEMLIRQRISLVTSLVDECGLQVQVSLVLSESNKADALTRVPQRWLITAAIPAAMCVATDSENIDDMVKRDTTPWGTLSSRVRGEGSSNDREVVNNAYPNGEEVWVRPHDVHCDRQYNRGVVKGVVSEQAVEINGVPRHVRDLRHHSLSTRSQSGNDETDEDYDGLYINLHTNGPTGDKSEHEAEEEAPREQLRLSTRDKS